LIFVDTSGWVALADSADPDHRRVLAEYVRIRKGRYGVQVTSNYILAETLTMLKPRIGVDRTSEFVDLLGKSRDVQTVWIEPVHHRAAVELMLTHADKKWSLVDCSSFVVMRGLQIAPSLTLDRNYVEAGFARLPDGGGSARAPASDR
jgi:predicted nucleic acid-binding protein